MSRSTHPDPTRPALLGSYPDLPPNSGFDNVSVVGKYAFYEFGGSDEDLVVLDVSDPAHITEVKNPSEALQKFERAAVTSDMAFVGSWEKVEIYALDNLDAPVASLDLPTFQPLSPGGEDYTRVSVVDSRLYVSRSRDSRLIVVDISDLAHPYVLAQSDEDLYLPEAVYGDYLYFNGYYRGLSIYKLVLK